MHNTVTQRRVFDRYLTEKDETTLLKYLRGQSAINARRDLAWIEFVRCTGIRVGTLCQVTVADAVTWLATGTIDIRDEIAKGGRGYELFLVKRARRALSALLKIRTEQGHPRIGEDPLIMSRNGGAMQPRTYQIQLRRWAKRAGLSGKITPHWLRHTLAKRIMANSTSHDKQAMVQAALGHRSRNSTVIYTLPDKQEVALALQEAV